MQSIKLNVHEEVIEMIGDKFGGISGFIWAVC